MEPRGPIQEAELDGSSPGGVRCAAGEPGPGGPGGGTVCLSVGTRAEIGCSAGERMQSPAEAYARLLEGSGRRVR